MVITPKECMALSEEDVGTVSVLEKRIDVELRKKYDSAYKSANVDIGLCSTKILRRLMEDYTAAGWDVTHKPDPKSAGVTLIFKKKPEPSEYYDPRDQGSGGQFNDR